MKKYDESLKEQARMLYALGGSIASVARELGVPRTTVSDWLGDRGGLEELREERRRQILNGTAEAVGKVQMDFVERAAEAIELSMDVLREKLRRELREDEGKISVSQLMSVIGTLYDKRLQAENGSKSALVTIDLPQEAKKYAE